jgi:hypothetical protein
LSLANFKNALSASESLSISYVHSSSM